MLVLNVVLTELGLCPSFFNHCFVYMMFCMVILCSALSFFFCFFVLFLWLLFNRYELIAGISAPVRKVKRKCVVQYLHVLTTVNVTVAP